MHKLIDFPHKAPQEQIDRYHNLLYLRSVDEDKQAPPLSTRPGYQEGTTALVEMQRQSQQDLGILFIPKSGRRLLNQLNPSLRGYFEWLSTNWAEYFAEEREPPTSSSSSQWSSTSWWCPHSESSNWQGWHPHSWQDDKWSEQR